MGISNDKVIIFDTTLRDGEQALNASLSVHEKLQIAHAIERLGVDIMEVGFPVSSLRTRNSKNREKLSSLCPCPSRWRRH